MGITLLITGAGMPRPISATLSLSALTQNLNIIRGFAPDSKVWTVVKANGYGHGISRIWRSLSSTDGFALLDFQEAVLLREAGWLGPILMVLLENLTSKQHRQKRL